jgi:mono/diheme cytochrome c family protein
MRVGLALALLVSLLVLSGCGGGGKQQSLTAVPRADHSAGGKVFGSAGCGGCHTLQQAGSAGTVGPNLDQLKPTADKVASQVRSGGNGMPSFAGQLSATEIQQVADYVAAATRTATGIPAGFTPDDTKVEDCADNRCYEQAFANVAYEKGPKAALTEFRQVAGQKRDVLANCHQIAHMIGAGGLLHFKGNLAKAFAEGNPACGSGYYHGLLQWKLAGVQPSEVAEVAREACNDPEVQTNRFTYYQCDHGLGHGLMLYTAYDLPRALDFCHGLDTKFDQTSCSGGVFMENMSSSFGIRSKWLNRKDLLYPCDGKIVRESDRLYCYGIVAQRILPAVGYSWEKTAAWCRRAPAAWVDQCLESYGRSVASATQRDPAKMRALCRRAGGATAEDHCVIGAVIDVLNNNGSDPRAAEFCNGQEPDRRAGCYRVIGFMVATLHPDSAGRQDACRRFAEQAADYEQCLRGATSS